jgi:predicted nucleotidyltransferase component of viral defense system
MNIRDMLQERFKPKARADYIIALKTLVQEMVLIGLGRAKFFEHAAFYGGTALRIVYQLPRFSEDLDFTLLSPIKDYSLKPYFQAITTELTAFGFQVEIVEAAKQTDTQIESAFIKANTRLHLLKIGVPDSLVKSAANEVIKVKFEVDTNPPHSFDTDVKFLLVPIPFSVKVVSLEQMFAGKIHAILCRNWKTRVKGRDWYDLVWFVIKKVSCPVACVESRMRQSGHWTNSDKLDKDTLKQLLSDTILRFDLKAAQREAMLFVDNPAELEFWSKDFFAHCVNEVVWI